eukprot:Clim_evm25s199 gene=Clim_evmTU25s199
MKCNENLCLIADPLRLVPYESRHVPLYHEWMKSEELQELTGSEPLSLQEEYDMQRKWRDDEDKLTFIILDTSRDAKEESCFMIGDINLFVSDERVGEVELMVAEPSARGKGYGIKSVNVFLSYGK